PTNCAGDLLNSEARPAAEAAARTSLAALALAATVFQSELGYDLRSRSLLIPDGGLQLEFLGRDGTSTTNELSRGGAMALLKEAAERAAKHGMQWESDPVTLAPTPKLEQLIRMSRELARTETEEGEQG
ncbi:MAG: type I-U CRISPR-associated protein Cas7, partial [Candidatus Eisenbacteria bacterium]|nr:type I-U CRISPR-associated protein Cas7 [Candidatus Eisenbacteria bacterium]